MRVSPDPRTRPHGMPLPPRTPVSLVNHLLISLGACGATATTTPPPFLLPSSSHVELRPDRDVAHVWQQLGALLRASLPSGTSAVLCQSAGGSGTVVAQLVAGIPRVNVSGSLSVPQRTARPDRAALSSPLHRVPPPFLTPASPSSPLPLAPRPRNGAGGIPRHPLPGRAGRVGRVQAGLGGCGHHCGYAIALIAVMVTACARV